MYKILVLLVLFLISDLSYSSSVDTTISSLMVDRSYGDKAFIRLTSNPSSTSCGTNPSWRYVLDTSDEIGKTMYSNLLTLYASGKTAKFIGSDVCTRVHTGIEELTRIELK